MVAGDDAADEERFVKMRTTPLCIALALALVVSCAHRAEVVLTEADNRSTIAIAAGETLVVRLASNPTTGYRWKLSSQPQHLELEGGEASFDPPARALPGAGGHEVFRFRGTTAGREPIELRYQRGWETNTPPAAEYRLTVEIK